MPPLIFGGTMPTLGFEIPKLAEEVEVDAVGVWDPSWGEAATGVELIVDRAGVRVESYREGLEAWRRRVLF